MFFIVAADLLEAVYVGDFAFGVLGVLDDEVALAGIAGHGDGVALGVEAAGSSSTLLGRSASW